MVFFCVADNSGPNLSALVFGSLHCFNNPDKNPSMICGKLNRSFVRFSASSVDVLLERVALGLERVMR
jgi:hypothetical protein